MEECKQKLLRTNSVEREESPYPLYSCEVVFLKAGRVFGPWECINQSSRSHRACWDKGRRRIRYNICLDCRDSEGGDQVPYLLWFLTCLGSWILLKFYYCYRLPSKNNAHNSILSKFGAQLKDPVREPW